MVPIKLQLHNFLSYREPKPLNFTSFNLAVLSGNNGVGKSSILEAITWAVWGQSRAGSDDELIHQGTTSGWVEFIFEHEGSLYRIVRRRELKKRTGQSLLEFQTKHGKSKTLIDDDHWESITEATLKTTNEKIIRILKIPYKIFVNSSYLRQGHADEFTIKTPAERKEILAEVLGLNYYEELAQKARGEARAAQEKTKLLVFQIEDLQSEITRKKEVESQFKTIRIAFEVEEKKLQGLKKIIINLEKQNKEYEVINEKLNILRQQFSRLQQEAQELNSERDEYLSKKKTIELQLKHREKINELYEKFLELEKQEKQEAEKFRQFSRILQELKGLEQLKIKLDDDTSRINRISTCPMCQRTMRKQEASEIVQHLRKEFEKKYGHKLVKLQDEIKKLGYHPTNHQKIQQQLQELNNIREQKQALNLAENNLKNTDINLKRIQERYTKIKNEAGAITKYGTTLKDKLPNLKKANLSWQAKKQEEETLNRKIMDCQNSLGALKQELKQIGKQEKELKLIEKQHKQCQNEGQTYEELSSAFGKKGIQAMIIEQSLITIEEGANDLLKKITSGRMSLKIISQKAKKAPAEEGELMETLEIKISDELGSRDYEMYSGGEAFRINFAIRIAISKLLAARAGAHLKFLAIDEGFGMLDAAGRDDIVAAINSISHDFEKILVITHIPELKDLFPTKIEVTKDEHGSQIEMVG